MKQFNLVINSEKNPSIDDCFRVLEQDRQIFKNKLVIV